jgi:hypothetical protein
MAADPAHIDIAVNGNTALVMWSVYNNYGIDYILLDSKGAIKSKILNIGNTVQTFYPNVESGNGKFLVSYGRLTDADSEIFTILLGDKGRAEGAENRITYTDTPVTVSTLTYDKDRGFAIAWLSDKPNGSSVCVDSLCNIKSFAALLNNDGSLASESVFTGPDSNYLAPSSGLTISSVANEWITGWRSRRNFRGQLSFSTFTCE